MVIGSLHALKDVVMVHVDLIIIVSLKEAVEK